MTMKQWSIVAILVLLHAFIFTTLFMLLRQLYLTPEGVAAATPTPTRTPIFNLAPAETPIPAPTETLEPEEMPLPPPTPTFEAAPSADVASPIPSAEETPSHPSRSWADYVEIGLVVLAYTWRASGVLALLAFFGWVIFLAIGRWRS